MSRLKGQLTDPLLSVVMPAYNERDTIEEMIRRVLAIPIRTELIVVDDGSRDGTRDILSRLAGELPFPGTGAYYVAVVDTFVQARSATNARNASDFLAVIAAPDTQLAFSKVKGSVPVRSGRGRPQKGWRSPAPETET